MVSQPTPLSALGRKLSRLLRQVATAPKPEAVHHLRTSIRRLEASLERSQHTGGRIARKSLKKLDKLRNQAGKVRDLDVQIAALQTINLGRDRHRQAQLAHTLSERRERQANKLAGRLDAERIGDLRLRLRRILRSVSPAAAGANPAAAREAARQFAQLAAAGPAVDSTASYDDQGEALHGYRMRCKQIRYTAELAGDTPVARRIITEMTRLQDAIGEWHDWVMLRHSAEKYVPGAETTALHAALQNLEHAKFAHALRVEAQARRAMLPGATVLRKAVHSEAAAAHTQTA